MRTLNSFEKEIIEKKMDRAKRHGKEVNLGIINAIEYRSLFPRATLCVMKSNNYVGTDDLMYGITMRGRKDPDNPMVGEVQSFVRALNEIISHS